MTGDLDGRTAERREDAGTRPGNTTLRVANTALLSVTAFEAPCAVTSEEIDDRLAPARARLKLPRGLLQRLTGVLTRRWWDDGTGYVDGAVAAGAKALAHAGVAPERVGLLVNTSVTRSHLEPSVAVAVHHGLGLPSSCLNFDLANACLGFVNAMSLAAGMIDAGQIDYAVIVDGEDAGPTQRTTIEALNAPDATREDFNRQFATLTLGSGAAAAVLGPADRHPGGHRVLGGVTRADTAHPELCVGGPDGMYTDTQGLLDHGLALVLAAWHEARAEWDWASMDRYVTHQVSAVHTHAVAQALGLDTARVPLTFPRWGNVGPAALPMTLAAEADSLAPGDRVLCMGVGSGLNTAMTEIAW